MEGTTAVGPMEGSTMVSVASASVNGGGLNGLGSSGNHNAAAATATASNTLTVASPSSRQQANRARFSMLGAKLTNMEPDLANQQKLRFANKERVAQLSQEVAATAQFQKKAQGRLLDALDRIALLESSLNMEKGSRQQASLTFQRACDERIAHVLATLDKAEAERNAEVDTLRSRVAELEGHNKRLKDRCEEQQQTLDAMKDRMGTLSASSTELQRTLELEKIRRESDAAQGVTKKVLQQVEGMLTDIQAERQTRQRDVAAVQQEQAAELAQLRNLFDTEKRERERVIETSVRPLAEDITKMGTSVKVEEAEREAALMKQSSSLIDRMNNVRTALDKALKAVETEQSKRLRGLEDHVAKLSATLQSSNDAVASTFKSFEEDVAKEVKERSENDEEVFRILESLSERLRVSLEEP